jgi:hypothetical protein
MPAINMRGTAHPLIRVANTMNGLRTALILRNTNTTLSRWKDKAGVDPVLKFGPNDYRMWMEGLNSIIPDYPAPITNFVLDGRSTDGVTWTLTDDANTLAPKGADWELGEICINCVIWNPYSNGGEWWAYYHGANNGAPRAMGLLTSPTALPGTWKRYWNDGKPILSGGATYDAGNASDGIVCQLGRNNFKMLYWASTAGNVTTLALATSTDGKAWTKYAGNPVMGLGTGNDATKVLGAWAFLDANQRVHVYYCGEDSGGVGRVLYAYSDDFITFVRDPTDVKLQGLGGGATSSEFTSLSDSIRGYIDDHMIVVHYNAFKTPYGDAIGGRMEARNMAWCFFPAAYQPVRPARGFYNLTFDNVTVPVAAAVMTQNVFSVWLDFRCMPNDAPQGRVLYMEDNNYNAMLMVNMQANGQVGASQIYRTPSQTVQFANATRYDDNKWHRLHFRRTAAGAFELLIDGVSIGTSALSPGVNTAPGNITIGGTKTGNTNFGTNQTGCTGAIRRVVTCKGYAMTNAEELALWNNGAAGGLVPTAAIAAAIGAFFDLKVGSGGQAGPDLDVGTNAYSCAVTGSVLVDGDAMPSITSRPKPRPRGKRTRR